MQNLALGIAHITLQFRQQRNGSRSGHRLKHIFGPVLTHSTLGHLGSKIAGYNLSLFLISYHRQHTLTETVDSLVQFLSLSVGRREHHVVSRLLILLIADISDIAILAIGLNHDGLLQTGSKVIQRVAHLAHLLGFVVPLAGFQRVSLQLLLKGFVDGQVLLGGVTCSAVQTFLHNRKTVEHLVRNVKCQHRHQDNVHQVNHPLTWRNGSFLDCHSRYAFILAVIASIIRL